MIESVLVANRGEIAVRIIRSARDLGVRTIAVYSDLDRDAPHVQLADEAWAIGPAPASESYLNGPQILRVAKESNAAAIHPGYGFLAENGDFAQAVLDAGIIWVGPPPSAIKTMGDKIASRLAAAAAGVRSVPGTLEPLTSVDDAAAAAAEFGYPVAIKAAHGGGGKGLRVVQSAEQLEEAFDGARREADAYFGDPAVYVEKYLARPRHIEAQILTDAAGITHFLGERDCSVQRRHQKLIEETPAFGITDAQRTELATAARLVADACDYQNAGTVEFLMDEDGSLYFLEMNTRLQVEHTVTEAVTGIDMVHAQLRIASGESLNIGEVTPRGHAVEFRINAEDPAAGFLPCPGQIVEYREPAGFGVRVDGWVTAGTRVTQYYDNLIAKLIVWGATRDEALARARRALSEYTINGVATTIPAHRQILDHPTFIAGKHTTKFVEQELDFSGRPQTVSATLPSEEATSRRTMTVEVGGRRFDVTFWAPEARIAGSDRRPSARRRPPKLTRTDGNTPIDAGVVAAPMQGTIVKVSVAAGDRVHEGATICVLEAMKMENEVKSPISGEVVELRAQSGDTVTPGQVIAIVR